MKSYFSANRVTGLSSSLYAPGLLLFQPYCQYRDPLFDIAALTPGFAVKKS